MSGARQNRLHDSRRIKDLEIRRHTVIRRYIRPSRGRSPFEPFCAPGGTLGVYFGGINASSIGLGNLVPSFNGQPMNPPGSPTGPLPPAGTYWVTACLDVSMGATGSAFCDCIQAIDVEVIIQAAASNGDPQPPPDATLACGAPDDPATSPQNEAVSPQSGKIYFSLWQFNISFGSNGCAITHGITDRSNYYLCCVGDRLSLNAGPPWQN